MTNLCQKTRETPLLAVSCTTPFATPLGQSDVDSASAAYDATAASGAPMFPIEVGDIVFTKRETGDLSRRVASC